MTSNTIDIDKLEECIYGLRLSIDQHKREIKDIKETYKTYQLQNNANISNINDKIYELFQLSKSKHDSNSVSIPNQTLSDLTLQVTNIDIQLTICQSKLSCLSDLQRQVKSLLDNQVASNTNYNSYSNTGTPRDIHKLLHSKEVAHKLEVCELRQQILDLNSKLESQESRMLDKFEILEQMIDQNDYRSEASSNSVCNIPNNSPLNEVDTYTHVLTFDEVIANRLNRRDSNKKRKSSKRQSIIQEDRNISNDLIASTTITVPINQSKSNESIDQLDILDKFNEEAMHESNSISSLSNEITRIDKKIRPKALDMELVSSFKSPDVKQSAVQSSTRITSRQSIRRTNKNDQSSSFFIQLVEKQVTPINKQIKDIQKGIEQRYTKRLFHSIEKWYYNRIWIGLFEGFTKWKFYSQDIIKRENDCKDRARRFLLLLNNANRKNALRKAFKQWNKASLFIEQDKMSRQKNRLFREAINKWIDISNPNCKDYFIKWRRNIANQLIHDNLTAYRQGKLTGSDLITNSLSFLKSDTTGILQLIGVVCSDLLDNNKRVDNTIKDITDNVNDLVVVVDTNKLNNNMKFQLEMTHREKDIKAIRSEIDSHRGQLRLDMNDVLVKVDERFDDYKSNITSINNQTIELSEEIVEMQNRVDRSMMLYGSVLNDITTIFEKQSTLDDSIEGLKETIRISDEKAIKYEESNKSSGQLAHKVDRCTVDIASCTANLQSLRSQIQELTTYNHHINDTNNYNNIYHKTNRSIELFYNLMHEFSDQIDSSANSRIDNINSIYKRIASLAKEWAISIAQEADEGNQ